MYKVVLLHRILVHTLQTIFLK